MSDSIPCLVFEDEHLLVVNKPAGLNTHAPAPYAGEGLYDWLRQRNRKWSALAIIHRLDKETSGLIVFTKSPLANASLTRQFTERAVNKEYLLLTDRPLPDQEFTVRSSLVRSGDRYISRAASAEGPTAETRFRLVQTMPSGQSLVAAEPLTGRTHQIRVHAAEQGFPILGDILYGGTRWPRTCLHAAVVTLQHPASGERVSFRAPVDFAQTRQAALRQALIDSEGTSAFRLVHGAADDWPGWYLDRFGDFLLSASDQGGAIPKGAEKLVQEYLEKCGTRGVYWKHLARQPGVLATSEASPKLAQGEAAPDEIVVLENGVRFAIRFKEGSSVGLFLDQRDNRRRLLVSHIAPDFSLFPDGAAGSQVLNTFAYTCAFSVCAALAGATTVSLDLSRKYLDWGRRNFEWNELDPGQHDFIYGDAFDWMKRLAKKQRAFDLILLDPPTFSRSKQHGTFQVERDFRRLVEAALFLLKPRGVLFASANTADWKPEHFLQAISEGVQAQGRRIEQQQYIPQPPDFPVSRDEPAHLKSAWLRVG